MSPADEGATVISHSPAEAQKENYDVGYGKPPVQHRFKPGNSANPHGRKKGSRNRKLIVEQVLFGLVTVREGEGGKTRQMPAVEAVLKKMIVKALNGDDKAGLAVIGIAQRAGLLTPAQEEAVESLSETDDAIVQDVIRRLNGSDQGSADQPLPPATPA
jgi:hypothetical protein